MTFDGGGGQQLSWQPIDKGQFSISPLVRLLLGFLTEEEWVVVVVLGEKKPIRTTTATATHRN